MKYVSEEIGSEYKQWKDGDTLFISSPTGSGKTSFILHTFLPYWQSQGKRLLYLVNRSILKKQLEKEIESLPIDLRFAIEVETYQKLESQIKDLRFQDYLPEYYKGYIDAVSNIVPREQHEKYLPDRNYLYKKDYFPDGYKNVISYEKFDCVVCDEAHYFFMDSNYNTSTILSYNFVKEIYKEKLRIYMSATIDQIKNQVEEDNRNNIFLKTKWFGLHSDRIAGVEFAREKFNKYFVSNSRYSYSAERNYDYLDIGIIKSREEVAELITSGNDKWLIFVDSKEFGSDLKDDILKHIQKEGKVNKKDYVTFITADYELNADAAEEVEGIVNNNKQSAKVLIATSVLDNGINIKDIDLRNIIIIADTEIEFLQMLGRKRKDNQKIKLYIYKLSKNHFIRRKKNNIKKRECAEKNYRRIMEYVTKEFERGKDIAFINMREEELIKSQHKRLLQDMMDNKVRVEDIKSSFFAYDGILHLNLLSLKNLDYLDNFYERILKKFGTYGEDAFLREQLSWLNKTENEIDEIIFYANKSKYEISREKVIRTLEEVCDRKMNKEEFLELKNSIAKDLLELVEHVGKEDPDYEKYVSLCKKNERPISDKFMDYLRNNCDIPFCIKRGSCTVTRAIE